ncbi:MAG: glycosyltransferase [Mycobacteriales bacterium]
MSVVIPTRNRAAKLERCLEAVRAEKLPRGSEILVCDSSDESVSSTMRQIADRYSATYVSHRGRNVAAARNACARAASGSVLINVDDDVYVKYGSVSRLAEAWKYAAESVGPTVVVAGAVVWPGRDPSQPAVMRSTGYASPPAPGENFDFLIGAFFAYPRSLALRLPWNERIRSSDDTFMGALWRANGVTLKYCPTALATHDGDVVNYDMQHERCRVYVNLFDCLLVKRSLHRILLFELLGFLAGLKAYWTAGDLSLGYLREWVLGHAMFVRDVPWLLSQLSVLVPGSSAENAARGAWDQLWDPLV